LGALARETLVGEAAWGCQRKRAIERDYLDKEKGRNLKEQLGGSGDGAEGREVG